MNMVKGYATVTTRINALAVIQTKNVLMKVYNVVALFCGMKVMDGTLKATKFKLYTDNY